MEKPVQVHPADPVITVLILDVTKGYLYHVCYEYSDLLKLFCSFFMHIMKLSCRERMWGFVLICHKVSELNLH